jgi:hypothetical protein
MTAIAASCRRGAFFSLVDFTWYKVILWNERHAARARRTSAEQIGLE